MTSVLNSSGIGVPFLGSKETKSVAISASFHEASFNSASIEMFSVVFFVETLFLVCENEKRKLAKQKRIVILNLFIM